MPINVEGFECILAGRTRETTQPTGTGTYSLNGPATIEGITFRSFASAVGSGNRTVYTAAAGAQWETGIGTVTSGAPATLSRDLILSSSNGDNAVSWGGEILDIFCDGAAAIFHSIQSVITALETLTAPITKDGNNQYTFDASANDRNVIQIVNASDAVVAALRVTSGGTGRIQVEDASSVIQAVLAGISGGGLFIGGDESTGKRVAPILTFGPTSLSGTAVDFTNIPAGAREIDIGISARFTGNNSLLVQGGVGGTPETTGYTAESGAIVDAGASAVLSTSSGWVVRLGNNTLVYQGIMKLVHMGSNLWIQSHAGRFGPSSIIAGGGSKSFAGEFDMLRFTRNGSDSFDGGSVLATVKF